MDELTIFWTATALKQRDNVFEYWNSRTGDVDFSRKLNVEIGKRLSHLKSYPEMGIDTYYENNKVIAMGHYSIFYQILKDGIYVTGFWDNRQSPEKLFRALFGN